MESGLVEFILWVGFGLLIWALRDSLIRAEVQMSLDPPSNTRPQTKPSNFSSAQRLAEPMGFYLGQTIYRYAIIDGKHYRFDYVCPKGMVDQVGDQTRYVAPGLVYVECAFPR